LARIPLNRRIPDKMSNFFDIGEAALYLLGMFTLLQTVAKIYPNHMVVMVGGLLALGLGLLAAWQPLRVLALMAGVAVLLVPAAISVAQDAGARIQFEAGGTWSNWVGLAAAVAFVLLARAWPRLRERFDIWKNTPILTFSDILHGAILVVPAFYAMTAIKPHDVQAVAWAAGALVMLGFARRPGVRMAALSGVVYCLMAPVALYNLRQSDFVGALLNEFFNIPMPPINLTDAPAAAAFGWRELGLDAATGILILAFAILLRRSNWHWSRKQRSALEWVFALLALWIVDAALVREGGPTANYATALWGLWALVMLGAGFVLGVQPVRIASLIGLAICIPRAFVVDITETLHRIIAFMAISAVLLAVGFLYSRYGRLLQKFDEPEEGKHA